MMVRIAEYHESKCNAEGLSVARDVLMRDFISPAGCVWHARHLSATCGDCATGTTSGLAIVGRTYQSTLAGYSTIRLSTSIRPRNSASK